MPTSSLKEVLLLNGEIQQCEIVRLYGGLNRLTRRALFVTPNGRQAVACHGVYGWIETDEPVPPSTRGEDDEAAHQCEEPADPDRTR